MIYAWLAVGALIIDNFISDFVLHNSAINVVMFVLLWFFAGTLAGLFLCYFQKASLVQNFKALKPHWFKITCYLTASVVAPFLWMQSVAVAGIGDSVLLVEATGLISILFGVFYFKEKFSALDWCFLGLVMLGVVTFLYKGSEALNLSALLVFTAGALYSIQGIFKKVFSGKVDYVFLVMLRAALTAFTAFIIAIASGLFVLPTQWWVYALCAIGGILGSFANKYYWFKALETVDLSRFSIVMKLKTVLVYSLAVAFLGESVTWQKVLGGSLILLGVIFFSSRRHAVRNRS